MRLGLDIAESARISWSAIIANKARGALTTLGIIIGIVAVMTTMTAANGLAEQFPRELLRGRRRRGLRVAHAVDHRQRLLPLPQPPERSTCRRPSSSPGTLRGRAVVNPTIDINRPVKYRQAIVESATIIGTTEKQIIVSSAVPETGRFLMPFDVQYKASRLRDRL